MKKGFLLCILLVLLVSGCAKERYSSEFKGVPIYPGTELFTSNKFDNQDYEMYMGKYVNGDIEKVKHFFIKNIDSSIWTVEENTRPLIGNVEKIYGYILKSKDRNVVLTIAYSKSDKVGEFFYISITGDQLK